MLTRVASIIALIAIPLAFSRADDIRTRDGKVYKNATITTVTPAYVGVTHSEGVARVMLEDLPDELQKKYGYDPAKAAQHLSAEARAQQQAAAEEHVAAAQAEFDKHAMYVKGSIVQVPEGGVLFRGSAYRFESSEYSMRSKSGNVTTYGNTERKFIGNTGLIFIAGSFSHAVDGDTWQGRIWPAGTYKYDSVGAGMKTIERWATTREGALALLSP